MSFKDFLSHLFHRHHGPVPASIVDPKEGVIVQVRSLTSKEWHSKTLDKIEDQALTKRMNTLLPKVFERQKKDDTIYEILIPQQIKTPTKTQETKKKRSRFGLKGMPSLKGMEQWSIPAGFSFVSFQNSIMGAASFVVGQYYFAQIRERLGDIDDKLASIASFQNNEFKSKTFALLVQVKRSAYFRSEILTDPTFVSEEIQKFTALEQECMELLGQSNLMIQSITQSKDLSYADYEAKTKEAENWLGYSRSLWKVLCQIAEGQYLLHQGQLSLAYCESVLSDYAPQCRQTYLDLAHWQKENGKRLKIDMEKKQRERSGDPKSLWKWIPLKSYVPLDPSLLECLTDQRSVPKELPFETQAVYQNDVSFVVKDGEIYYEVETLKKH